MLPIARTRVVRALLTLTSLLATARPAAGQVPAVDSGGFVTRVGGETVVVERFRRAGDSLTGEIIARAGAGVQRVHHALQLGPDGTVRAIRLAMWTGAAEGPPARQAHVEFTTDSSGATIALARTAANAPARPIPTQAGAIPTVNVALTHIEQAVRRARALGGDSVAVPLFLMDGGRTVQATVVRRGADSVVLATSSNRVTLAIDGSGRVLGGGDPARRISFERVTNLPHDALTPAAPPDYSAPADAPYAAEQIVIPREGMVRLAGTLTLPRGARRPLPAVVLVSGSSAQDRDYRTGEYALFRWLADTLSRRGIAVLRVDDRGVGSSTGHLDSATIQDRGDDLRAEIAFLRARPDIDGARVGIVGLSEGGALGPLVAATDRAIAAVVAMAGPASTGREIMRYQSAYRIDRDSSLAPQVRARALNAAMAQADSTAATAPWVRSFLAYDPLPVARRVRAPVLILHGATDRNVPVGDAQKLASAIRSNGNRDVSVRVLPGTNHIFVPDEDGDPRLYGQLPSLRVPRETLGMISDWLVQRLATPPPRRTR